MNGNVIIGFMVDTTQIRHWRLKHMMIKQWIWDISPFLGKPMIRFLPAACMMNLNLISQGRLCWKSGVKDWLANITCRQTAQSKPNEQLQYLKVWLKIWWIESRLPIGVVYCGHYPLGICCKYTVAGMVATSASASRHEYIVRLYDIVGEPFSLWADWFGPAAENTCQGGESPEEYLLFTSWYF